MHNVDWVSMKTFQMTPALRGGLLSTFKLTEGKCATRYAKDCAVLRRFLKPLVDKDDEKSTDGNQEAGKSTDDNQKAGKSSDDNQKAGISADDNATTKRYE